MQGKPDLTPLTKLHSAFFDDEIPFAYGIFSFILLVISAFWESLSVSIALLVFLTLTGIYLYRRFKIIQKENSAAIQEFALKNGYKFQLENSVIVESGSLYQHGHSKKEINIMEGSFNGLPLKLSNYEYVTGSGKNSKYFQLRVIRLTLPIRQPHMVIDCLIEDNDYASSTLPIRFDQSQKIKLEGEFHKYFDLYATDQYAIDALSVIAPDAMDALMRMSAVCDIEIIDNYIYFYWPDEKFSLKNFQDVFETVEVVMGEIQKKLSTRSPIQKNLISNKPTAVGGVYLKKRRNLVPILFGAVFLGFYYFSMSASGSYVSAFIFVVAAVVISIFTLSYAYRLHSRRKEYFSSRNIHRR